MPKRPEFWQPVPKNPVEKKPAKRLARGKRVNPVSDKRRNDAKQYSEQRRFFLELRHYECELRVDGTCTGLASEIQHLVGRDSHRFLDMSTWKAACHGCHSYATTHPAEAYANGWAQRRTAS